MPRRERRRAGERVRTLACLRALERKVLWLSAWTIHNANHLRPSRKGLERSAGIMVNYLYRPGDIKENHEAYVGEGKIAAAGAVTGLLKG